MRNQILIDTSTRLRLVRKLRAIISAKHNAMDNEIDDCGAPDPSPYPMRMPRPIKDRINRYCASIEMETGKPAPSINQLVTAWIDDYLAKIEAGTYLIPADIATEAKVTIKDSSNITIRMSNLMYVSLLVARAQYRGARGNKTSINQLCAELIHESLKDLGF